jgi:hypothetical protein
MIKYILMMYVCSGVSGQCLPLATPLTEFDSYRGCNLFGHHYAVKITDGMVSEDAERYKLHIRFSCNPGETT